MKCKEFPDSHLVKIEMDILHYSKFDNQYSILKKILETKVTSVKL